MLKYIKPRQKFLCFHLYRQPLALQSRMFKSRPGLTWDSWEKRISKLCPIQFWLRQNVPDFFSRQWRSIKDAKYQIKCWFFPYNVLKIDSLPKTWMDEDRLLVHSMFACLKRFMDQNPGEVHDYQWNEWDKHACGTQEEWDKMAEPHRIFWKEINEVWAWWNKRDAREKKLDDALSMCHDRPDSLGYYEKYKEHDALEAEYEAQETSALLTIIKHRSNLWV